MLVLRSRMGFLLLDYLLSELLVLTVNAYATVHELSPLHH